MKTPFSFLAIILLFSACSLIQPEELDPISDISKHFNPTVIPTQVVSIDNQVENIIKGDKGIRIRFAKNCFIDTNGKPVIGEVDIELKEIFDPIEMVMANMTTTFEGRALETGGMIYLNATAKGEQLSVSRAGAILVSIPSDSILLGMSIFKGMEDSLGNIIWVDPIELSEQIEQAGQVPDTVRMKFEKSHNMMYRIKEIFDPKDYPDSVHTELSRIVWEGSGMKITKDSTIEFMGYTIELIKQDTLPFWSETFDVVDGMNSYQEDQNLTYVFEMNYLGWANIDRLLNDPRTEEVQMITSVSNADSYDYVYATMVTENMYLPGYRKVDGTYSFTHGDFEELMLPIGAKATIIASTSKNGVKHMAFKTITISNEQSVSLVLQEGSMEDLEQELASL